MKWINVAGLFLEFLAFWFAAPELLGEQSLKGIEKGLRRFIFYLPKLVFILIVAAFLIYCLIAASHITNYVTYTWQIGIESAVYVVIIIFIKPIQRKVDEKISRPLIEKIINSTYI